MIKLKTFEVGQNIKAVSKSHNYRVEGTIIKIIEPGQPLTELELKVYAQLKKGDRNYESVRGRSCGVRRLVLETYTGYTLVPVNFKTFSFTLLQHHPERLNISFTELQDKLPVKEAINESFDLYTHVANKHNLDRNQVKQTAFFGFYTFGRPVGRREKKARMECLIAQVEDSLEAAGLITNGM